MSRLFQLGKQFLTGELNITENVKYHMVVYPLAAVHAVFFFFFLWVRISPLAVYNLLSTIVYLLCLILLRKEFYSCIYYISSGEIILNTILTTVLLGWQCGFASFLFALVCAGFFISYTFKRYRLLAPAVFGVLSAFIYFFCYWYSCHHIAAYNITDPRILHPLYLFNSFCTFAFITFFSITFMVEMRVSQKKLFHENQMLGQMAGNDALTGLFNRWSMKNVMDEAIHGNQPFCLVMCDIDDFKQINDTYGHGGGDEVLRHISGLIRDAIPKNSYVCRWGGEEFLILLNGYSLESATKLSDHIRRTICAFDTKYLDHTIPHTITMGIAHHHKNQTLDSLLSRADMKLYIGKQQGKNTVVF